jgi:REP element-mobilizing transposase RayT
LAARRIAATGGNPSSKTIRIGKRFLTTLGEACAKTFWQVHVFCLMPNHFHLVVETPRANLVTGMKWFLGGKEFLREPLEQMGSASLLPSNRGRFSNRRRGKRRSIDRKARKVLPLARGFL